MRSYTGSRVQFSCHVGHPAPKSLQPHDFLTEIASQSDTLDSQNNSRQKNIRRIPRALVSQNTLVADFLNVVWFGFCECYVICVRIPLVEICLSTNKVPNTPKHARPLQYSIEQSAPS